MARTLYRYNPETCKYEPIVIRGKAFWRRVVLFLIASYAVGIAGLLYYNKQYPYWDETVLEGKRATWRAKWDVLSRDLDQASQQLTRVEDSDDQTFRTILDLTPLDQSVW